MFVAAILKRYTFHPTQADDTHTQISLLWSEADTQTAIIYCVSLMLHQTLSCGARSWSVFPSEWVHECTLLQCYMTRRMYIKKPYLNLYICLCNRHFVFCQSGVKLSNLKTTNVYMHACKRQSEKKRASVLHCRQIQVLLFEILHNVCVCMEDRKSHGNCD